MGEKQASSTKHAKNYLQNLQTWGICLIFDKILMTNKQKILRSFNAVQLKVCLQNIFTTQ